jgi:hypothetical protein
MFSHQPMTIEQTTQLIQITCNSLLLGVTSSLLLAALLLRQTLLEGPWSIAPPEDARRTLVRKRQIQQNQRCLLLFSYTSAMALGSSLCIALRMLVNWQWLIPLSLVVFAGAIALFLGSIGVLAGMLMGMGEGRRKRSPEPTLEKTLGRQLF